MRILSLTLFTVGMIGLLFGGMYVATGGQEQYAGTVTCKHYLNSNSRIPGSKPSNVYRC